MTTTSTIVSAAFLVLAAQAAHAGEPARLALDLPLAGKNFGAYGIDIGAGGERACIAGTDYDEMGGSAGRLLLVDRTRNAVLWQQAVATPQGYAKLVPVQCLVGADRVYLLANTDTSASPPQARSAAWIFAFDLQGKRLAAAQLEVPGQDRYGYALGESGDALKVAGYAVDRGADGEHYATWTATLDGGLHPRAAPLVRKNGAYTYPPRARMVGDSIYLAGRFFKAAATQDDLGEFAASRLRLDGGYVWSSRTLAGDPRGAQAAVAADGTSYTIAYDAGKTLLAVVGPDGKAAAPLSFASPWCRTRAMAGRDGGVLAVREPCSGKGNALVAIDARSGKEQALKAIREEAVFVAARGTAAAIIARDKSGKLYLYSASTGEL